MVIQNSLENIIFNKKYLPTILNSYWQKINLNHSLFLQLNNPDNLLNIYSNLSKLLQDHLREFRKYLRLIMSHIRYDIRPKFTSKNQPVPILFDYITPENSLNFKLGIKEITCQFCLINSSQLIYKIFNYIPSQALINKAYRQLIVIVIEAVVAKTNTAITFFLINRWLVNI